ncbi:MAG: FtsX-like permease family protein [Lachnospiraceae bacterium]|nr:FtsX-like permease family protein [Lachnospiraceae bacterium]
MSLFLIVFLGVAFYAGIRSCNPDMLISADTFYDQTNLADIRVMSALGITQNDVNAISRMEGVEKAVGTYSYDFICKLEDKQYVIRVMAKTDGINDIVLKSGRMPEKENECLIDDYDLNLRGYKLGGEIELFSGDDTEIGDIVSENRFVITGTFVSSAYLSMSMGTSSIGSGRVDSLLVVLPEVFQLDVFTEADILVKGAKDLMCYSDAYTDHVKNMIDRIDYISDGREKIRYQAVIQDATSQLNDAKKEYEDGKKQLEDAKKEYEDGKKKIEDAKQAVADGNVQLESARAEVAAGWAALADAKAQYEEARQQFLIEKAVAEAEINFRLSEIAYVKSFIEEHLSGKEEEIAAIKEYIYSVTGKYIDFNEYQAFIDGIVNDAYAQINEGQRQLDAAWAQISEKEAQLNQAQWQISQGEAEIAETQKQIEEGEKALKDAEKEIADGEEKLKDAEEELDKAEKEIAKIERAEWYVLNRNYLTEYSSYRSDSQRIGNIGKVFPVIFFIVAALVCLTTMTRMVDEERTVIGTLKAIGYSKGTIMRKYLLYALLATALGSVSGALVGSKILPYIILHVYKILYPNLEVLVFPYNLEHCLVAGGAALVCILAATLFACTKSLMEVPASLMRPVSPKQARKLLLERIPSVWSKIKFTWKNAFRNFVRYKKRLFMTLFGICGSTALLLVGFGLKDAINTILYAQFGEICLYDEVISIDPDATERNRIELENALDRDSRFESYLYVHETVVDAESANSDEVLSVYVLIPENVQRLDENIILMDRVTKERYELNDEEVFITEKMSHILNVKEGDTFTISVNQKDKKTLRVGRIVENYIYHYIYMTPALYEKLYGEAPDFNAITIVNRQGISIDPDEMGEEFMSYAATGGVTSIITLKEKFADILGSLDTITWVLIICAGALTFVVLYNLNNINISERRRELATLKVLGFYDIELSQYIYRENVLITIIGIALGVLGGIFLNRFVVTTVEVDIVMFGRQIFAMSFVKSILIAIAFTVIVNFIVHFKLKKIDMATSLKSVE